MPLTAFYDARQGIIGTDYNKAKQIFMTIGTDRSIKVNDEMIIDSIVAVYTHVCVGYFFYIISDLECIVNCIEENFDSMLVIIRFFIFHLFRLLSCHRNTFIFQLNLVYVHARN